MITFEYKGETIGEFPPESEKVLQTAMKYCEDDISVKSDIIPTLDELEPYATQKSGEFDRLGPLALVVSQKPNGATRFLIRLANAKAADNYVYMLRKPGEDVAAEVTPSFFKQSNIDFAEIAMEDLEPKLWLSAATVTVSNGTQTFEVIASVASSCNSIIRSATQSRDNKLMMASVFWYGTMSENMFRNEKRLKYGADYFENENSLPFVFEDGNE